MKLWYRGTELGTITGAEHDGPEVWASYEPNLDAQVFMPMWRFMTDEETLDEDPPVPPDYLDDDNWYVTDDTGRKMGVFLPAVYEDGTISWRWRD